MESYLMMLYVTIEQEKALKAFFGSNGWTFCKPDLSVTTDSIGPLKPLKLGTDLKSDACPRSSRGRPIRSAIKRKFGDSVVVTTPGNKVARIANRSSDDDDQDERVKSLDKSTSTGKNIDGTELPSDEDENEAKQSVKVEVLDDNYREDEDLEDMNDDGDNDDDFAAETDFENSNMMLNQSDDLTEGSELDESVAEEEKQDNLTTGKTPIRMVQKTGPLPVHLCSVCKFKCKSITLLRKHMERHGSTFHVCGTCGIQVTTDEELQEHLKSHKPMVKCGKCGEFVDHLKQHLEKCNKVSPTDPTCQKCDQRFETVKELEAHLNVCKVGPYSCDICGIVCRRISSLNRHKLRHNPDGGKYECRICGRKFFQNYDLYEHEFTHKPKVSCEACGKMVSNIKGHMKLCKKALASKSLIRCRQCGKVFASRAAKEAHMETCKPEVFQCELCEMTYTTLGSLRLHHKKYHDGEDGDFQCSTCGQRFYARFKLQEHEQLHKPKELCKKCGKMVHLTRRHEKICQSPKVQTCPYCGACIRGSASHLNRHIERHHRAERDAEEGVGIQSGKKKGEYECRKCGEKFMYKGWVEAHESECQGFGLARPDEIIYASAGDNEQSTVEQTTAEEVEVAMMLPSVVQAGEIGSETMLTDLATNTVYIIKH